MPPPDLSLSWIGDRHLRITLGSDTSLQTHQRVRATFERLCQARLAGVRDVTPAYATVVVSFDPTMLDPGSAETAVMGALGSLEVGAEPARPRRLEIPVCYEGECAPDTEEVARLCTLNPGEVAALHSGAEYTVRFIGFAPGFPYLGGLPPQLVTARLDRPRPRVPAGSVAIAGDQTGIYPHTSPGGWRVIGRTPRRLFDPRRQPPSLLLMGDRVRFVPIGLTEFKRLTAPPAPAPGGNA